MDTKSKTALLIAFALVGAFILGGMTATAGLAMTRVVAGALADGPGFAHGGPHMETDMHGRCSMPGQMDGDVQHPNGMRGSGMGEYHDKEMRGPWGMMPGHPDVFEQERGEFPEDARYGAECPLWGTF